MRKMIVVGTMHNMLPKYKDELKSILERANPDQILLEIDKRDISSKQLDSYPKEMVFAYNWAKKNKKQIGLFDVDMELWRQGVTQEDEDKIEKEWNEKYGNKSWKFFNKSRRTKGDNVWTIDAIIDRAKMNLRQKKMLENIKNLSIETGKILVLTGAYHLDFFKAHLREAQFPYA